MLNKNWSFSVAFVAGIVTQPFVQASSLVEMSLQELTAEAQVVIRVKVVSRTSVQIDGFPHWRVKAKVLESLRGREFPKRQAEFLLPGGQAKGDVRVQVSGVPSIAPGYEYLLFLSESARGSELVVTGWTAYIVGEDAVHGSRFLRQVGEGSARNDDSFNGTALSVTGDIMNYDDAVESILSVP